MKVYAIEHVQLAMPAGEEERARSFYHGVLGIEEMPKPPNLAERGGVWFQNGDLKIHLGVENDFRPAREAHPALLLEGLDELMKKCRDAGYEIAPDEPLGSGDIMQLYLVWLFFTKLTFPGSRETEFPFRFSWLSPLGEHLVFLTRIL